MFFEGKEQKISSRDNRKGLKLRMIRGRIKETTGDCLDNAEEKSSGSARSTLSGLSVRPSACKLTGTSCHARPSVSWVINMSYSLGQAGSSGHPRAQRSHWNGLWEKVQICDSSDIESLQKEEKVQNKRRVGALRCSSLRKELNAVNCHEASTIANTGTEISVAVYEAHVQ